MRQPLDMTHPDTDPTQASGWNLPHVVKALRESREVSHRVRHQGRLRELPSREVLTHIMQGLSAALFPTHYGRPDLNDESIDFFVGHTLHDTLGMLNDQVRRALMFNATADASQDADLGPRAVAIVRALAEQLPDIRGALFSDLQAAWQGDPAATGMSEILLCYPGITAIVHHRIAHALLRLGTPLLARLIADIAHARTGIDIHPGAQIGRGFFIDHGTGVVIGETCVIGENVRLYQAVTLGAKRFPTDENGHLLKGQVRHPIVEDDVVIYAGATVLGRITIGRSSTIGGNVWLTQSVPPHSNVSQALSRQS